MAHNLKYIILQKVRFSVGQIISRSFLESTRLDVMPDIISRDMRIKLSGFFAANKVREEFKEYYQHPSTWWQMLKQKYASAWFKRRYPVEYKRIPINIQYWKACPHVNIWEGHEREHIEFMLDDFKEGE